MTTYTAEQKRPYLKQELGTVDHMGLLPESQISPASEPIRVETQITQEIGAAKKTPHKGDFKPGNPYRFKPGGPGRQPNPNRAKQLTITARGLTKIALKTLVDICERGTSQAARVQAANSLLDRGWGKPMQARESEMPTPTEIKVMFGDSKTGTVISAETSHQPPPIDYEDEDEDGDETET